MMPELNNMSDNELISVVRRDKNGRDGKDAVSALILRYMGLVLNRANAFSGVYSDVEDLTQEGLLAFYKAVDSFNPENGAKFSSYADVCVSNRIKTVAAGIARLNDRMCDTQEEDIAVTEISPENICLESESVSGMSEEIRSLLAPVERKVFGLYLDGMPYKEIAAELGMTEKSVDNAVFRIRKKLKNLFSDKGTE